MVALRAEHAFHEGQPGLFLNNLWIVSIEIGAIVFATIGEHRACVVDR